MKLFFTILAMLVCNTVFAQNILKVIVKDDDSKKPIAGATAVIPLLKRGATSDSSGLVIINNIPNGKIGITFSSVGYISKDITLNYPLNKLIEALNISLEPMAGELAEVTIQTTRTNQNIKDIPTRFEALPLEELDEKGTLRPGDIKMLLGETTGIQVQQTSAVSGSANFRIEGLDSRYTQLLKDGMPLYQGFSGGLSLLQIPPLDLQQVEFIKASASTLYGGGAIAGLVNLISKTPEDKPELTLLVDGTSAKGVDVSGYYSEKWAHIGTTIFSAYNYNGAYAPDATTFTAIPKTNRFTLNPKVFFYINDKDSGWIGVNGTYENRLGGDIQVIDGKSDELHQYFEKNITYRFSTQLSFTHKIDTASEINFKNTIGYFNRDLTEPGYIFSGRQTSSYSEVNYVYHNHVFNWVVGGDLLSDKLNVPYPFTYFSYNYTTIGGFVQNTYKATKWFSLETGIRLDYNTPAPVNKANGVFILPRINSLFKINGHLTSRIGGGLGYKMPTLFSDQTEEQGYRYIQPVIISDLKAEQSYGFNGDLNYRNTIGDAVVNINQLFFYTIVNRPLLLINDIYNNYAGRLNTSGAETNLKLFIDNLGIYLGYTYTDTKQQINDINSTEPLIPKNRISADVTYEVEDDFRAGIEGFYNSRQLLSDGTTGRGFWTFGLLIQKSWKRFDIFINAENLTDQRQTRWDSIYTGTITNPIFKDIYAPLDGLVINAGIKIKLL
jgi:outer membrane receptor for ferrienterochelin and colicins